MIDAVTYLTDGDEGHERDQRGNERILDECSAHFVSQSGNHPHHGSDYPW